LDHIGSFSSINACEVICLQSEVNIVESVLAIEGIQQHVVASSGGPLKRLTIHVQPGLKIKNDVTKIIGEENIESIITRDPTMEEAYISIIM
jgi:hypothetical protein